MACEAKFKELSKWVKDNYPELSDTGHVEKVMNIVKDMSYEELANAYFASGSDAVNKMNWAGAIYKNSPVTIVDVRYRPQQDDVMLKFKYAEKGKVYELSTNKEYGHSLLTFKKDIAFDSTTRGLRELMSSYEDAYINEANLINTTIDNVNDPAQMLKLAEDLSTIGDIDEEYKSDLMSMLSIAVNPLKKYIPEMRVWLDKEAERNGGKLVLDGNKVGIQIAMRPGNAGKSPLEVFVHEVTHAATAYAIESKEAQTATTIRRLQDLRKQFMEVVMENPTILGVNAKEVMEMLKYVGNKDTGIHEFVAYAMSNKEVMSVLKGIKPLQKEDSYPNMFSRLVGLVKHLLDLVTNAVRKENANMDAHTLAMKLIQELMEANNRATHSKKDSARAKIVRAFSTVEESFKDRVESMGAKVRANPVKYIDKDAPVWKKVVGIGRTAMLATVDDRYKTALETSADLLSKTTGFGWLAPEKSVRSAINAMAEGDNVTDAVEKLMFLAASIQQRKEDTYSGTAHDLQDGFTRKLTAEEETFLTSTLLDTDAQALLTDQATIEEMPEILRNDEVLDGRILTLENELKDLVDQGAYNYMSAQAKGLGAYLVTNKGHIGQLLNAWNIARLAHTSRESFEPINMEAVDIVDKLASYYAWKALKVEDRNRLADMMEEESNGLLQLLAYHASFVTKSRYELFAGANDRMKELKGYTKQVYDKHTDITIAPISETEKLQKMGFVKVADLKKHSGDTTTISMAIYKSNIKIQQNLNRVTLMYNGTHRRGTSFTEARLLSGEELQANSDIKNMKAKALKEANAMMAGTVVPSQEESMTVLPIYNIEGKIKDFRYVATKDVKENLLGMDRRAIAVLARGMANIYEKSIASSHNEQVLKVIEADAKNYNPKTGSIGLNNKTYIQVSNKSEHPEIKDLWKVLPKEIKDKYPKGFPVRQDMLHWYLGQRSYSIADSRYVQMMPHIVAHSVRIAEQVWKDIVKMVKVDIVIRTPIVLIQNVITNIMLSITTDGDFGANIVKIAKMQLDGVKELNEYLTKKKELMSLERKMEAGLGDKRTQLNIDRLRNDLKSSSIDPLMEEGFYTTIAEDLGLQEYGSNDTMTGNKIVALEQKLPPLVRNGLDWAYLSTANPVFKFLQAATVYSDFVARYAHYNLRMEQKGKYEENLNRREKMLKLDMRTADDEQKKTIQVQLNEIARDRAMDYKKKVIKDVREAFVNYNKPIGFEYANEMGFIMFTKWYFNIQRALKNLVKGHPLKAMLSLMAQDMVLGIDVETIEDNGMLNRMLHDNSYGKVFGVSMVNPFSILEDAVHPHGFEIARNAIKLF